MRRSALRGLLAVLDGRAWPEMAFWKRPARWASVEHLLLAMTRDDQWAMVTRHSMSMVVCCCEVKCSDKRTFLIRGGESVRS